MTWWGFLPGTTGKCTLPTTVDEHTPSPMTSGKSLKGESTTGHDSDVAAAHQSCLSSHGGGRDPDEDKKLKQDPKAKWKRYRENRKARRQDFEGNATKQTQSKKSMNTKKREKSTPGYTIDQKLSSDIVKGDQKSAEHALSGSGEVSEEDEDVSRIRAADGSDASDNTDVVRNFTTDDEPTNREEMTCIVEASRNGLEEGFAETVRENLADMSGSVSKSEDQGGRHDVSDETVAKTIKYAPVTNEDNEVDNASNSLEIDVISDSSVDAGTQTDQGFDSAACWRVHFFRLKDRHKRLQEENQELQNRLERACHKLSRESSTNMTHSQVLPQSENTYNSLCAKSIANPSTIGEHTPYVRSQDHSGFDSHQTNASRLSLRPSSIYNHSTTSQPGLAASQYTQQAAASRFSGTPYSTRAPNEYSSGAHSTELHASSDPSGLRTARSNWRDTAQPISKTRFSSYRGEVEEDLGHW